MLILVVGAVASSLGVFDEIADNYFSEKNYYIRYNGIEVGENFTATFDAGELQLIELSDSFSDGGYNVSVRFCRGEVFENFGITESGKTYLDAVNEADCTDSFDIKKGKKSFTFTVKPGTSLITALESCYGKGNVSVPEKVMMYNDYNFALVVTSGDGKARFAIRFNFNYLTESVDISNEKGEKQIIWINGKE